MIDEERVRQRLQQAIGYEPPRPPFGTQSTSTLIATRLARPAQQRQPYPAALALVAVLIAIALVATLVLGSRAFHSRQSVPAHAPPGAQVGSQSTCNENSNQCPVFISADVAWIAENVGTSASTFGPFALYGTIDAGRHWTRGLTWACPGPSQILFNAGGSDGLVVAVADPSTNPGPGCGPAIFHTADGGAHWKRLNFPAAPQSVLNNPLVSAKVFNNPLGSANVFFLNSHEGWVHWSAGNIDEFFHTTDSGASWTVISEVNRQAQFANFGYGQLAFRDSLNGFFLPYQESTGAQGPRQAPVQFYVTHDGGVHWQVETLTAPPGRQLDMTNYLFVPLAYSEVTKGALEVAATTGNIPYDYVYITADKGDHWSYSVEIPAELRGKGIRFIDSQHWVGWATDGGLLRTDDGGKHWHLLTPVFPASTSYSGPVIPFYFEDTTHGWSMICPVGSATSQAVPGSIWNSCLSTTSDGGAHWIRATLPPLAP
jgi:photosystem II stability/assembly factor-like uncharacterized protein